MPRVVAGKQDLDVKIQNQSRWWLGTVASTSTGAAGCGEYGGMIGWRFETLLRSSPKQQPTTGQPCISSNNWTSVS
jgi:hypothetical protein